MAGLVERASGTEFPGAKIDWALLARCLSFGRPGASVFEAALEKACTLGAYPFDVVAGTPLARYGARITFSLPDEKSKFLAAFGLDHHPWGPPQFVGLRTNDEGQLVIKAYHQVVQPPVLPFHVHERLGGQLDPYLAALYQGATENYFMYTGVCQWREFASMCLAGMSAGAPSVDFQPYPRLSGPGSFGASFLSKEGEVHAITLHASYLSLPDDETIVRLWTRDMPDGEREAYELTMAAVRSCGARRFGAWHSLLAWTFERDGTWHRAACFHFPVTK
jgi:hypothetical protein